MVIVSSLCSLAYHRIYTVIAMHCHHTIPGTYVDSAVVIATLCGHILVFMPIQVLLLCMGQVSLMELDKLCWMISAVLEQNHAW
jgi:hypothetical protein